MGGAVVSRLIVLVGGTLYPAYASYKAVKSANVRQYVRWMMYWVVFAIFTTVETFTDYLLSWVPFYYEVKVGFIIWLLSPYTKGAAFLYRKFIHPFLTRKEPEIDHFLSSAKEKSYATMLEYGSRGINVAATAMVTAAVKGQAAMSERLKSFSVNDISRLSDDTPVHSMNPLSFNRPIQREILRTMPDVQGFETTSWQQGGNTPEQDADVDTDSFEVINPEMMAPSGGLTMHPIPPSRDLYDRHDGGGDGGNIGSQYKAYSMMNLSQTSNQGETIMTRRIEFTSAPPETSVDDSMIPDHVERAGTDDRSYSTIPRQRRKSKKDKESSSASLRRSKRKAKAQSYHEDSENEREQ